jgi:hypothetical protein
MKNNAFVVNRDDMTAVITDDPALLTWNGHREVVIVDRKTYSIVEDYVVANKEYLDSLMVSLEPGTTVYWEENHHDRIVTLLSQNYKLVQLKVSNALWTLGY